MIPIRIPPLRERTEDIPLLVNTFIRRLQIQTGKAITGLTRAVMERFMVYHWPGNVRELKSALEYAFVVAEKGLIDHDQLPPRLADFSKAPQAKPAVNRRVSRWQSPHSQVDLDQKNALIEALRQTYGNQSQAARLLGVCRATVWNRMRKYGIDPQEVSKAVKSESVGDLQNFRH